MKTNYDCILEIIDLIEEDLSENYNIDILARHIGYSKYHMHKMFTHIVDIPIYQYIKKRRLSEAAKRLLHTEDGIIDIALKVGYESQQSFTTAFKEIFHQSPKAFRQRAKKFSLTPRFDLQPKMLGERITDVRLEDSNEIILAGYSASTMKGFLVIPRLWNKLHKVKVNVPSRQSAEWAYALNDYEHAEETSHGLGFEYYACIEVESESSVNEKMTVKRLPVSRYAIFSFRAKPKEPIDKAIGYIYKEWFPASSYQLNHEAKYDFVRYGEVTDGDGIADIEVWVPIL